MLRRLAAFCTFVSMPALLPAAESTGSVDQIIVTTTREGSRRAETPASVSVVDEGLIESVRPGHPAEILGRVPGIAVQQTNGEGHITGIRQPIGTSPVYLYLEDAFRCARPGSSITTPCTR